MLTRFVVDATRIVVVVYYTRILLNVMIIEMMPLAGKRENQRKQNQLTKEILDDLSWLVVLMTLYWTTSIIFNIESCVFHFSRFIINVPEEERQNLIRICFQIELAHWFYIDFYCDEHNLQPCSINQFALHMFRVTTDIIFVLY